MLRGIPFQHAKPRCPLSFSFPDWCPSFGKLSVPPPFVKDDLTKLTTATSFFYLIDVLGRYVNLIPEIVHYSTSFPLSSFHSLFPPSPITLAAS